MKRADPKKDKRSGSESYYAKMVKLSLSWGTGSIGSISPTIQGQIEEAQKSTLSGGRNRRGTEMGVCRCLEEKAYNCILDEVI